MTDIDAIMASYAARFAARVPDERDALSIALQTGDQAALADRAHKLAGTAGMFGHHAIGEAGYALETAILAGEDPTGPARALIALLEAF